MQASETLANMVENAATQAFKAQRRGWQGDDARACIPSIASRLIYYSYDS